MILSSANDSNWRTRSATLTYLRTFMYRYGELVSHIIYCCQNINEMLSFGMHISLCCYFSQTGTLSFSQVRRNNKFGELLKSYL